MALPRRWDPVKLEGDAAAGHALFADALRPKLGLRWQTPRRRLDPDDAVHRTMTAEVGRLAAAEATDVDAGDGWVCSQLYVDPAPPGRDVWVGYSDATDRLLTIAYHGRRRDRALAGVILPTLGEWPPDAAAAWAVFDLSLTVPADFALVGKRLNAGDLSLSFADRRGAAVSVRQIAVAELALRRRSLDGWIAEQQKAFARVYRPTGRAVDVAGSGRSAGLERRRRFALAVWHPRERFMLALHDRSRDRLVILDGTDPDLLTAVATSVGEAEPDRQA